MQPQEQVAIDCTHILAHRHVSSVSLQGEKKAIYQLKVKNKSNMNTKDAVGVRKSRENNKKHIVTLQQQQQPVAGKTP